MTEITEDTIRIQAREIILNHAHDVEYMSIGEHLADFDEFASLSEDESDRLQGRIDKMIRNAVVTVSWPDEQDGPSVGQLAARIAELEAERDGAYRERAHLVALLASQYPSHIGYTDPTSPDWAVVTVELDTGQACWHVAAADMRLFAHVEPTPRYARGWDGHTTEEKYARLDRLACQLHAAAERRGYRMVSEPDDTAGSAT